MMFARSDLAILVAILIPVIGVNDQAAAQPAGPKIHGVILDPTSSPKKEIGGIAVLVYSINQLGENTGYLGQSEPTAGDGVFNVQCSSESDRLVVWFIDRKSTERGFVYPPIQVQPLSGRRELLLNPAIIPRKNQSPNDVRTTLTTLPKIIPWLNQDRREWVEDYVADVADAARGNSDPDSGFALGAEMAAVVKLLRATKGVAVTGNFAWCTYPGDPAITGWQLPDVNSLPMELLEDYSSIPLANGGHASPLIIAPSQGGLSLVHRRLEGGRPKTYQGHITLVNKKPDIKWTMIDIRGDATVATGVASQPVLLTGTSEGTVVVTKTANPAEPGTYEVGRTPVSATALARDGRTFGAATIDGSYGVWRLNPEKEVGKAAVVASGRIPRQFPATMSFSPDGQSLVVGTGLGKRQNGIVTITLKPGHVGTTTVADYPATITKIEFFGSTGVLATMANGTSSVSELRYRDDGIALTAKKFELTGIQAFGSVPGKDAAVLLVKGKTNPVVFPAEKLFDKETFRSSELGIKLTE